MPTAHVTAYPRGLHPTEADRVAAPRRGRDGRPGIIICMEFEQFEVLDGFEAPLRFNLKPFELVV